MFAAMPQGNPLGACVSPSGRAYGRSGLGERQCFQLYAISVTTQHTALFIPIAEYDALRGCAID
jgi:hypothetical protein